MSLRQHIPDLLPTQASARSFVVLALALGALYAVINPPFAVNDERDHWLRVIEITKGRLRSRNDEKGAFYSVPNDYFDLVRRYGDLQRSGDARVDPDALLHDLTTPPEEPPRWIRRNANASVYSPLPYLPQIPAVWLARVLHLPPVWQLYFARVASLAGYALISAWAIAFAGELGWVFFVLGLMPMSITQAAGLSGDGMGQALSFFFFALIARGTFGASALSKRETLLLLGTCGLLSVCKPPNLLFTLAMLALNWDGPRARLKRWLYMAAGLGTSLATLALWTYLNRGPASVGNTGANEQSTWLLAHPTEVLNIAARTLIERVDDYAIQFVAVRDLLHRQMPFFGGLLAGLYLPLLLAVTLGASRRALRLRAGLRGSTVWIALSGALYAGAVFLAMYLFATPTAADSVSGAQGRYFIPAAPAFLLVLSLYGNPALGRWLARYQGRRLKVVLVSLNLVTLGVLSLRYYGSNQINWPF